MKIFHLHKKERILIALVLLTGLILAALIIFSGKPQAAPDASLVTPTAQHHEESEPEIIALTEAQIKQAGIAISNAAPANIGNVVQLTGEIRFNEDLTAHVVPRLGGVVESVPASLGQIVKKGQLLAVIASTQLSELRSELLSAQKRQALAQINVERERKLWQEKISAEQDYLQASQNLKELEIAIQNSRQKLAALGATAGSTGSFNRYELRAPFDGVIVEKHLSQGEMVKEDSSAFTISDLSSVWAEITVPAKDLDFVRTGEIVTVKATASTATASGKIVYVSALLGEQTRSAKARVTLANPGMAWRPGLFVDVVLMINETEVPVAILAEALQTIKDKPVVFIRTDNGFQPLPVKTGRSDGKYVEIVEGLKPGTPYAVAGSFVIKAEQGKDSAEHDH
ncbi:efflux RND transporter periplasmic adaptor subunit [Undibacterium sp. TJN19]|uniref:efflux RND transporter periplasmic adaptor subunit n=1 Tax=Undibacterium sp. TJN19 TaxID=3413055 RepID=UPI003BF1C9D0